jgi:dTDP-4-amino-4,6-dideoxygalactose transaminase
MATIALMIPDLPAADAVLPYLRRIDANRWYTNFGPLVQEFEKALADQVGGSTENLGVVTAANATVGIEMALQALGLSRGARVLVPALTFVATATAVMRAGFEPVISDVNPHSWLLTPDIASIALPLTHVDAVLPVATFGCPQDVNAWQAWSEQHDIPVVIDAAGAFGNQPVGRVPTVFSLHATKSLGIGEGGFIASTRSGYLDHIRQLSNFGFGPNHGDVVEAGTNGKMSEYHAAVGLAALPHWRARREIRLSLQDAYRRQLQRHCTGVVLQDKPEGIPSILAVALPAGADAGQVASRLAQLGIETRRWYYPPLFEHPAFATCQTTGALEVSRELARRIIGLPFHVHLKNDDIATVCTELAAAIDEVRSPSQSPSDVRLLNTAGSVTRADAPAAPHRNIRTRTTTDKRRALPRL